ncbi:Uncharacterized mitochondrial protein AtMg00310 [Linum perenne]
MLGKQGWRLISDPNALVSRVLKAKYYPDRNFLQAQEGKTSSFTWKSIYASQVILRRGIRWKIGDGESIRVWNTPWLRDDANFRVETPPFAGSEEFRVKELFVNGGVAWDEGEIQLLFGERDWKEILSLPGGCSGKRDDLVWHFGKDGLYSVRSGYHVLMERIVDLSYLRVNGDWPSFGRWTFHLVCLTSCGVWQGKYSLLEPRSNVEDSWCLLSAERVLGSRKTGPCNLFRRPCSKILLWSY